MSKLSHSAFRILHFPILHCGSDSERIWNGAVFGTTVSISTRLCTDLHGQNDTAVLYRRIFRFYICRRVAPIIAGPQPAGLLYLGHYGVESHRKTSVKFGRAPTSHCRRTGQLSTWISCLPPIDSWIRRIRYCIRKRDGRFE